MKGVFSTAYLPSIAWMRAALHCEEIMLEAHESWQKQSYRNRCYILGPAGPQFLNIPIVHNESKDSMGRVEISYTENWQHNHWQTIQSAYGTAPFFEVLAPELEPFYSQKTERLFDWNRDLLNLIFDWLQVKIPLGQTDEWQKGHPADFRESFHPKRPSRESFAPYPQVFDDQLPFAENLSVLDLLFNEGPAAWDYLKGG